MTCDASTVREGLRIGRPPSRNPCVRTPGRASIAHIVDHPARAGQGALRRFRETGEAAALVEAVCDVIDGKRAVTPVKEALEAWSGDVVIEPVSSDALLIKLLLEDVDEGDTVEDGASSQTVADQAGASRFAPFEPAYLADELFQGLPDDEHPAAWIARWLSVIFPEDGTAQRWPMRLKDIPEHAQDLVLSVIQKICAAPDCGGAEIAELVAIAAELMLPSKLEGRPRAPHAALRLCEVWRQELPKAINAWTWSDDAFAGFFPVLEILLACPLVGEDGQEPELGQATPELLCEIATSVARYSADRRERVIEKWPEGMPRPKHGLSDTYPGGEMDYIFVDPTAEEVAAGKPILAMAKRFSELVATVHHMVCPLPRDLMLDLTMNLRQLNASPKDVGWLVLLADQMVEDWSFNWLGDTDDWPDNFRDRHPASVRADQVATIIDEIRSLGLDALADAMSVWLLGTQVLFWEGDMGLAPARLKAFLAAITTRETVMRAALARVEAACRETAAAGSAYGKFYAQLLATLIPAPKRPNLVMLDDRTRP